MRQFKGPSKQGGWVQMALGLTGMGVSLAGGRSAKKRAKRAGRAQARAIWATYKETARRKDIADQQKLSATRAAVGASGIRLGQSAEYYLKSMQTEITRENDWMEKEARMNRAAARAGAAGVGSSYQAQAVGQAIGYAGQAAAAGYEWWTGRGATG